MTKKLDLLHYVLIGGLALSFIFLLLPSDGPEPFDNEEEHEAYLIQKSKADSLLLEDEFDAAYDQYVFVDSIFPEHLDMEAINLLIEHRKLKYGSTAASIDSVSKASNEIDKIDEGPDLPEPKASEATNSLLFTADSNSQGNFRQLQNVFKGVLHFTIKDGAEIDYIGEVIDGKANGYGFAIFERRGLYEGEWKNNLRHGKGIYYWQSGDIYEGDYIEGKREGYGVYTFFTGDVYKGEWKDNLRHGEGTLYNKKGKVVRSGKWVEDEPVMTKKKSKRKKK